jgi:hypothetical protein
MKLTIEVEVPFQTVEDVQAFTYGQNEYSATDKVELHDAVEVLVALYMSGRLDYKVELLDAIEVLVALYMSDRLDYKVTKAEMIDDGKEVIDADGNAHWQAITTTDKRCHHKEYKDGYCAEMVCKNYYGAGRDNAHDHSKCMEFPDVRTYGDLDLPEDNEQP